MAKIYIVEDDQNILEIETYALSSSGFETEGFDRATAFLERIQEELPDLVLLDIMLPDIDGLEILRKLRSDNRTSRLPIIMTGIL